MKKLFVVLFLLLPTYAMAQAASSAMLGWPPHTIDTGGAITFNSEPFIKWYISPKANTCRGVAPGGLQLWGACKLAIQKELVRRGWHKNVAPGSMVFRAQDVAKSAKILTDNVTVAPKVEEKTKPVIIPNSKRQEWAIISLQLENAKLKAEAAVPAEIKKAVKDANDALDAFWKSVGVNPAELTTKWDISDGQNGDIILTPKTEKKIEEKPKTP